MGLQFSSCYVRGINKLLPVIPSKSIARNEASQDIITTDHAHCANDKELYVLVRLQYEQIVKADLQLG